MFAVTIMTNFDFAVMRLPGDYLKIHSVKLLLVDVYRSFFSPLLHSSKKLFIVEMNNFLLYRCFLVYQCIIFPLHMARSSQYRVTNDALYHTPNTRFVIFMILVCFLLLPMRQKVASKIQFSI